MRRRRTAYGLFHRKKSRSGGLLLFALYFLCVVLLVFSRLQNEQIREARGIFSDIVAPVLQAASQPAIYARRGKEQLVDYLDLFHELDRLKEENQNLKHWQWQAQRLERRLDKLRGLLNAVDEAALKYATGQVIADARGPFARSILVNVGRSRGIREGYAVINGDGFVGRVVHAGDSASRVILVTDLNSRIPVLVGPSAVRAVLVGDNGATPRLEFLPNGAQVFEGDEVSTSGHAGLLPRGLRIGSVVAADEKESRVRPHAALSELEYVSILFFDTPVVVARDRGADEKDRASAPSSVPASRAAVQAPKQHANAPINSRAR